MIEKASEIISLKALSAELKIDPKEARERLRGAARDAKKLGDCSLQTKGTTTRAGSPKPKYNSRSVN